MFLLVQSTILCRLGVTLRGEAILLGMFQDTLKLARQIDGIVASFTRSLKRSTQSVNMSIWDLAMTADSTMGLVEQEILERSHVRRT